MIIKKLSWRANDEGSHWLSENMVGHFSISFHKGDGTSTSSNPIFDRYRMQYCFEEYYNEGIMDFNSLNEAQDKAQQIWEDYAHKVLVDILEE
jgi:hypothetical protein